jgi:hypothetical protein
LLRQLDALAALIYGCCVPIRWRSSGRQMCLHGTHTHLKLQPFGNCVFCTVVSPLFEKLF